MSSGRRGVLALLLGTASGQTLILVSAPVLSRLYSPADFGVFAVISAVVAVLGTVAALRFELAIPLPVDDGDAYALVALGVGSSVCVTALGLLTVGLAGDSLAKLFHISRAAPWLWFVPVVAGAMGIYNLLSQLAIRHGRYAAIARRNVAQSAAVGVTQISAGLMGFMSGGLIIGLGVGQLTSALTLGLGAGLRTPAARAGMRLGKVKAAASQYRRFPLMLAPAGLINVAGQQVPLVLIAYWYGPDVAGWLGMTQRVLALPVMLIGTAVAQVYLGNITEAARQSSDGIREMFLRTSRRLLIAGLLVGLLAALLGPWIFSLVLGTRWTTSGQYAQALSLSLAAQLVAVPLSQTLIVLGHQLLQLIWDFGRLVATTGAVTICWVSGASASAAVWSFGLVMGAAYSASWLMSRHKLQTTRPDPRPRSAIG